MCCPTPMPMGAFPAPRRMKNALDAAETFHHDGENDEAIHGGRQYRRDDEQMAIAAKLPCSDLLPVDDGEHQRQDAHANEMGDAVIGHARDPEDEACHPHGEKKDQSSTYEEKIVLEALTEDRHELPPWRSSRHGRCPR